MPKQIGNLEVPEIFERWDNPLWVGEEADKYRNVVKDYGHSYFDKDLSMYSDEDRELWNSNPNPKSIPRLYLTVKYDNSRWLSDLEVQLGTLYGECKDIEVVKGFISEAIGRINDKLAEVNWDLKDKFYKDGNRNTSINYNRQEEKYYDLRDKKKKLEEWL